MPNWRMAGRPFPAPPTFVRDMYNGLEPRLLHCTELATPTKLAGFKMASGESGVVPDDGSDQEGQQRSVGSREEPSLQPHESPQPHASPQLSRRALDELGQLQGPQDAEDPENYPLYSPWAFWFER